MIECVTVTYVEAMASVSMYDGGVGGRSMIVCGGVNQDTSVIDSCEELSIGADGLPVASSWRYFASLPSPLFIGCMLQVNGAVRVCLASFFV